MSGKDPKDSETVPDARDDWLFSVFETADINNDGFLDEEESLKLITVRMCI